MTPLVRSFYLTIVILCVLESFSQTKVSGNIITKNSLSGVERNFTGFNSSQGYLENIYKNYYSNSGLEVNKSFYKVFDNLSKNISWRFPGGTTANFYNRWASGFGNAGFGITFGDAWSFSNINTNILNANYSDYNNYVTPNYPNSRSNVIFPFINSITRNKTVSSKSVFCINIVNHYRNASLIGYDSRRETLRDTNKIKEIVDLDGNYLDAFNNSTLSKDFKKIVRQNIDAFLTLINNGVSVYKVEMGNEIFSYIYRSNLISDYNSFYYNNNLFNPSDTKVWIDNDGSPESIKNSNATLWTYARLSKMYRLLLTDTLQKLSNSQSIRNTSIYSDHLNNMKFGVPISITANGGFRTWDNFMLDDDVKVYIGIDAYIMHPYLDCNNFFKGFTNLSPITNRTNSELTAEFNNIRDTLEISYNKRFFKQDQVNLINKLPKNSEVWYTEWNFNFDNNNMKKVGNTLLHAMYYYDVIMDFFDINANKNLAVECNKKNPIRLCNYQLPYAKNGTWYNMTSFKNGYNTNPSDPYTTTNSGVNTIEYNSPYYAALLLSPVLEDTALQYLDNINGGFDNIPNCAFRSFYKKECASNCCHDEVYIYFNNKSDSDYTIDLSAALNINDTLCVTASSNFIFANNMHASMGQTTFRTDGILYTDTTNGAADVTIQRAFNKEIIKTNFNSVLIPKYALGYIKVSMIIPTPVCACTSNVKKETESNESALSMSYTTKAEPIIKVYPNPNTTGNLFIDIPSNKDVTSEIRIFDVTGNLVKTFQRELFSGDNSVQIDLYDIAKSTYIIQINGDDINFTSKIILQ